METQKINLLDLTDRQRAKVLKQARTYLQQQLEEANFCRSVAKDHKAQVEEQLNEHKSVFLRMKHLFRNSNNS